MVPSELALNVVAVAAVLLVPILWHIANTLGRIEDLLQNRLPPEEGPPDDDWAER